MNKSRLFILVASLFLALSICNPAMGADPVCDLNRGSLGSITMGKSATGRQIQDVVRGRLVKDVDDMWGSEFYAYPDQGVNIVTEKYKGKTSVVQITIYLIDIKGIDELFYKKFRGQVVPGLSGHENPDSIRKKFGKPDEAYIPIPGDWLDTTQLIYKRPFGQLSFWFNKHKELGRIDLME